MSIIIRNSSKGSAQKKRSKKSKQKRTAKTNQRTNAPPARARVSSMSPSRTLSVHPCVVNYAKALTNPWDMFSIPSDVCIPDDNDVPSFKFRVRKTGTFTTGTNLGFVVATPLGFANGDLFSIMTSTAAYVPSLIPNSTGATPTNCVSETSNSLFQGGSNGLGMPRIRCVCFGVRVRYTGTELNRGGSIIPFRSRLIAGSSGAGLSFSQLAGANQASVQPVKRRWTGTVYTPVAASERVYFNIDNGWDLNNSSAVRSVLVAITPPGGSPSSYEYDIVGYYEAIANTSPSGTISNPPAVTPSDSDVDGYSFVRDAYSKFADSAMGQAAWDAMKGAAASYVNSYVPFAHAALEWK